MDPSCSEAEEPQPYWPQTYREDHEIPFAPDGNAPLISGYVEKVKGTSSLFQDYKCVRKTIPIAPEINKEALARLKGEIIREAKMLHMARHHHVVELVHTYFEKIQGQPLKYAIIMDRADTNLESYLRDGAFQIEQYFGCLIKVVHYIHSIGIRHRDIKPSNVLIKGGRLLLADFGLSQMGVGKTMPTTYQERRPSRTREYCAPEVDKGSTRGRSADIFSLGAVLLEMLLALNDPKLSVELSEILKPSTESVSSYAEHIDAIQQWIRQNLRLTGWQTGLLKSCQSMLEADRDARPSASGIYESWLSLPLPNSSMICRCVGELGSTNTERLLEACQRGSVVEVKHLLDKGIRPLPSHAIHYAAACGSTSIVQALLEAGVDVDVPNCVGQTALQCAARNGNADVVQQLLEHGANVNASDENGQTALHGAASQGDERTVMLLCDAKADLLAEDHAGRTAIHFASRRRHTLIQALLKESAEQTIQTSK